VAILGATTMQCTKSGEPLGSILEQTLEVCGACYFSRRYRAGLGPTSLVVGVDPIDMIRVEETAGEVRDQGELQKATWPIITEALV
jgi:hypothetical protein